MYTIENKRTYYLVDRNKGKTFEIGDYSDLIEFMSSEYKPSFIWCGLREIMPYENFDFSGNDKSFQSVEYYGWKDVRVWDNTNDILTSRIEKRYGIIHDFEWRAKPYMVIDDAGAIVNVRLFDADIRAAHERRRSIRPKQGTTKDAIYGDKYKTYIYRGEPNHTFKFRQGAVPHIHNYKSYYSSYAHPPAQNHKDRDKLRPRTRVGFWGGWDGKYRHTDRCWKSSCKQRHQWQKHQK